jgi:hypothetical protein
MATINLSGSNNINGATATANGGNGGSSGATGASGGDALAMATGTGGSYAGLSATANGGQPGNNAIGGAARAVATGTAPSGGVGSSANTSGSLITTLHTYSNSTLGSTDVSESYAAVAAPVPDFSQISGLQAASFATGMPSNSDVLQALAGDPIVASAFDIGGSSTMLGLVTMGQADSSQASSQANFTINVSSLSGQDIIVGLIDPHWTGYGFDQLHFTLHAGSTVVVDMTFTSLSAALDYFNDGLVNLGAASLSGNGNLSFSFTVYTSPGNSFYTSMLIGTANSAPVVQSAFSRKTHGAAGTFDIPLPLTGNVGIECRSGGATNDYELILNFMNPVTVGSASVVSGAGSVSGFSVSGSQVAVNLTGATNVQRVTVRLFGVNDGTHAGNVFLSMGVLVGDVNGNAIVNASDVVITKSQLGQPITASNFREDVSANGTINLEDVAQVKGNLGHALP